MKIKDIRELSLPELKKKIRDFRDELVSLRVRKQVGQVENPARLRTLRRDIARCETVLTQKESAAS